jgi:hypothetical protein
MVYMGLFHGVPDGCYAQCHLARGGGWGGGGGYASQLTQPVGLDRNIFSFKILKEQPAAEATFAYLCKDHSPMKCCRLNFLYTV